MFGQEFTREVCCDEKCNISFAITNDHYHQLKRTGNLFYCPNGHGQHYNSGRDKKDIELNDVKQQLRNIERRVYTLQERERELVNEVQQEKESKYSIPTSGSCPICEGRYSGLKLHMRMKHFEQYEALVSMN